ncbi:MAG TPA: hypothetical protein VF698_10915 [Thermoanaerobaculia bacterium]|jgi:hypothetical protein
MDKSDWKAVSEEIRALERERLGPPPREDEVLAYLRGELPEAEAERVRDLLVCYPELALAVSEAHSEDDDPGILSEHELAQNWAVLRSRTESFRRRTAEPKPWTLARVSPLAAVLMIGVASIALLQWRWSHERDRLIRQLREPRVHGTRHALDAIGTRGPSGPRPYRLPADEENFLLAPTLVNQPEFPEYRIDIVNVMVKPPATLWSRSGFRRHPRDGTLELSVPRAFLPPGIYRLDVYGLGATSPELLASYLVEAP